MIYDVTCDGEDGCQRKVLRHRDMNETVNCVK